MSENKIVIDDKNQKVLEVNGKKVVGYRITERYFVIKLENPGLISEEEIREVLRDNLIQYKLVEVIELEE